MTPLDAIMTKYVLRNTALVEIFPGELSHKTVQKARMGTRAISKRMQQKVVDALNAVLGLEKPYKRADIFGEAHPQNAAENSAESEN
ncbi:hypothetical protein [Hallerella porci]|uniref:Uncharacterized protein n=1 Tax=Hallerella porci TaxID=1945871 RepID=A0ABX5LNW0_9BACT|nr:hypothetical protein [Hallerella porci]PWL04099.1 hypothetical protein B0H50_101110 [Hallerella porci]